MGCNPPYQMLIPNQCHHNEPPHPPPSRTGGRVKSVEGGGVEGISTSAEINLMSGGSERAGLQQLRQQTMLPQQQLSYTGTGLSYLRFHSRDQIAVSDTAIEGEPSLLCLLFWNGTVR